MCFDRFDACIYSVSAFSVYSRVQWASSLCLLSGILSRSSLSAATVVTRLSSHIACACVWVWVCVLSPGALLNSHSNIIHNNNEIISMFILEIKVMISRYSVGEERSKCLNHHHMIYPLCRCPTPTPPRVYCHYFSYCCFYCSIFLMPSCVWPRKRAQYTVDVLSGDQLTYPFANRTSYISLFIPSNTVGWWEVSDGKTLVWQFNCTSTCYSSRQLLSLSVAFSFFTCVASSIAFVQLLPFRAKCCCECVCVCAYSCECILFSFPFRSLFSCLCHCSLLLLSSVWLLLATRAEESNGTVVVARNVCLLSRVYIRETQKTKQQQKK